MCERNASCGCCATERLDDSAITNPPGLGAIGYRGGTHGSILRRMVGELGGRLRGVGAGSADDPAVGLLDAFATMADVVTFYQERIANEGYLRTATERESVLELAQAIGYELRPGVAATTHLDVRVQVTTGATEPTAPTTSAVPKGTQVKSIPAPGKLPQTFETAADLVASADRNEIGLRLTGPQTFSKGVTQVYFTGTAAGLRVGDAVIITGTPPAPSAPIQRYELRIVHEVSVTPAHVLVTWDAGLANDYGVAAFQAVGLQTTIFGSNAPPWRAMPHVVRARYGTSDPMDPVWPDYRLGKTTTLDLDGPHPDLRTGSLLLLRQPGRDRLLTVSTVAPDGRDGFAITAKTTRVTFDREVNLTGFSRRRVVVYTQTRALSVAEAPLGGQVGGVRDGGGTELDLAVPTPLVVGQAVFVTGTDTARRSRTEFARVAAAAPVDRPASIVLDRPLRYSYARESVRILGNVVAATQGETVSREVLGSGDGTVPNQRFTLKKKDLTHLAAAVTGGVTDTLEIRVDGVRWSEVPSLYRAGPHDRVYVVRIDDDGFATVIFGDGDHGARLPTGQENVLADYRFGVGLEGDVAAHALTLLPQRPLGVSGVDNPREASGAADPEHLADARANAPLTVLTLDRVVSLRDYEDYAQAFAGIAKARATSILGPTGPIVYLSLAGPDGAQVSPDTIETLLAALDVVRDSRVAVEAGSPDPTLFRVGLDVLVDPDRVVAEVQAAVGTALRAAFSVDRRSFGQAVRESEVLALAQDVPGVRAATVTGLELTRDRGRDSVPPGVLLARDAHWTAGPGRVRKTLEVEPAQLLIIDPAPAGASIGEMVS
jgi:predicted regulator of Ras-like GTPase activity (Roadblock/LC7/MglB family)